MLCQSLLGAVDKKNTSGKFTSSPLAKYLARDGLAETMQPFCARALFELHTAGGARWIGVGLEAEGAGDVRLHLRTGARKEWRRGCRLESHALGRMRSRGQRAHSTARRPHRHLLQRHWPFRRLLCGQHGRQVQDARLVPPRAGGDGGAHHRRL